MLSSCLALTILGAQVVTPVNVDGTLCHPRNLILKVADASVEHRLRAQGLPVIGRMPQIGYVVVEAPAGKLRATRSALRGKPGILAADYDKAKQLAYTPNDPLYGDQWSLHPAAMNVQGAWDLSRGTTPVTVAVIDTGVNWLHEDLAANMWINTGEVDGNAIDDDGNGYVDDVYGYDFTNNDGSPADDHGHGTLCSGVVAATQDNNLGVSGVAPMARIMAIKAANSSGYFFDSWTAPAYIYAADNGARVFSCSFFSDQVSQVEKDAMDYAVSLGVLPVVAAGNANTLLPHYPAGYDNVIAVAALDSSLNKAGFSNYGFWVDVAAPGVSVRAPHVAGGYGFFSGTSLACPNVAGLAALLMSAIPGSTASYVRSVIEDSAVLQNQAPYGEFSRYGRVDALAAMTHTLAGTSPAPKSPIVYYMTPVGSVKPKNGAQARVEARGLGAGTVEVRSGNAKVKIGSVTRDWIEFKNPVSTKPLSIYLNGVLVATINQPLSGSYAYPLCDASTDYTAGATLSGGFEEALLSDTVTLDVARRSDGWIHVFGTLRRVEAGGTMNLTYRRHYSGTTLGTETVEFYNWSSASYPYGNWTTLHTGAVPMAPATSTISVPNSPDYVDPEGTILFRIRTSTDIEAGGVLHLDQFLLGS